MTLSFNIECDDCQKKYRIRYGLGNNYPQMTSFQCYNCSKQIETGYNEQGGDMTLTGAYVTTEGNLFDPEIQIINLHPEIPTRKGKENDPSHFHTFDIFENLENDNADLIEFRGRQYLLSKFHDKWSDLERPLRIFSSKGVECMNSICKLSYEEFKNLFDAWMTIFIEGQMESDFSSICKEYHSIDTTPINEYIKNEVKLVRQINEFCHSYMKHHQYFQSTVLYQKYGWKISDDAIANVNWDDIQKVYGDLYEIIGDLFVIPTMMNNLSNGRKFDEFQTVGFTLDKYLKTDKANRAVNFQANPSLSKLSSSYHSWLRNGTHHKNCYLNTKTHEISLGTSKGGTVEKKISVIEYIKNCNDIFGKGIILSSLILEMKK